MEMGDTFMSSMTAPAHTLGSHQNVPQSTIHEENESVSQNETSTNSTQKSEKQNSGQE